MFLSCVLFLFFYFLVYSSVLSLNSILFVLLFYFNCKSLLVFWLFFFIVFHFCCTETVASLWIPGSFCFGCSFSSSHFTVCIFTKLFVSLFCLHLSHWNPLSVAWWSLLLIITWDWSIEKLSGISVGKIFFKTSIFAVSLVVQTVKNLPAMWETWVRSLGWKDPLQKETDTHSSILA